MTNGLVGRKCGMTRVFTDTGAIPVTVIQVEANKISQIKTVETDGYNAVQIATNPMKASKATKALAGHLGKAGIEASRKLLEFRHESAVDAKLGDEIKLDIFNEGQYVDVTGVSKGKGFAGVIKRWNFAMQDATHGNSLSHRAPGSIGQNQTPGRVFKGKKMAGHMGNKQCTVQNIEIVKVDTDKNLILVKGAIPGATGGTVVVKPAVKIKSGGE